MVKTPQRDAGAARQLHIAENLGRFISNYSIEVDLSDLRTAFESCRATGDAQYIKRDSYEAATQMFVVSNDQGEYRLNVQLKGKDNLTFHLTPGLQKPVGKNLPSYNLIGFVNGLRLVGIDVTPIDRRLNKSLEVTVDASLLQSDMYTVTLYKIDKQ